MKIFEGFPCLLHTHPHELQEENGYHYKKVWVQSFKVELLILTPLKPRSLNATGQQIGMLIVIPTNSQKFLLIFTSPKQILSVGV